MIILIFFLKTILFWLDFGPLLTPASQPGWINPTIFIFFETFPKARSWMVSVSTQLAPSSWFRRSNSVVESYHSSSTELIKSRVWTRKSWYWSRVAEQCPGHRSLGAHDAGDGGALSRTGEGGEDFWEKEWVWVWRHWGVRHHVCCQDLWTVPWDKNTCD